MKENLTDFVWPDEILNKKVHIWRIERLKEYKIGHLVIVFPHASFPKWMFPQVAPQILVGLGTTS